MKRHNDALAIQCGACNPSGIALAIVEACREIRAQQNHKGTAEITSDPAVRLMVHQLAYLTGVIGTCDDLHAAPDYAECSRICAERAKDVT